MQATIELLQKIPGNYSGRMRSIPEEDFAYKPFPEKWSKKEILGHLVDSAQNNIRRFVVAQYEETPTITYNQDKWVNIAGYQHYPVKDLLTLWELLNRHIGQVLANTPAEAAQRKCGAGGADAHTIEWLAADYCNHLLHHLHQILELEPIAYP
ncbi:MAG TPA: DinB family protein [Puia sp.]|nr:DinB family protein [Puia sp.]